MTVPGYVDLEWEDFVNTTKEEHPVWKESKEHGFNINPIGKDHYIFKTPKGEVSMIRYNYLGHLNKAHSWCWEIYSHGQLFEDVERYDTWAETRERIKQVLAPDLDW